MNRAAVHHDCRSATASDFKAQTGTRCGLQNYNRPLVQRSMLLALMKDARGGSIR
jgi:hypothetical protein